MWEAWGSGRVPVGVDAAQTEFDTVEKTGGEKTHTLSIAEAAVHYHLLYNSAGGASEFPAYSGKDNGTVGGSPTTGYGSQTTPTGGGEAHNNLQPYVTCYIWKRTA
jgi:microcystin-dependent protein